MGTTSSSSRAAVAPEPPCPVRWVHRGSSDEVARTPDVTGVVDEICRAVQERGEEAVRDYSGRFDGWTPRQFRVDRTDIEAAYNIVGEQAVADIRFAADQVSRFADAQRAALHSVELMPHPGIRVGHRLVPVEAVGCYVPGGQYPLVASAYVQVVTARVAGVDRVIACAPSQGGDGIAPATLAALDICGTDEIYAIGGVQALAAMAYGTSEIEAVDMVTGPGNPYVAEAKRRLSGTVGIDAIAGPTDLLIIGDATADADIVACDLLSQAEHGVTSPVHLATDSIELASRVARAVEEQLHTLPTRDVARAAWESRGTIAVISSREDLAAYADWLAPEHVSIQTSSPEWFHTRLRNYGAMFLGHVTATTFGDKAAGPNPILPTRRSARFSDGLWVGKFLKARTYCEVSEEGVGIVAPVSERIANLEGLYGHAASCKRRLARYGNGTGQDRPS
jgi:sulfopropanediol 3-dehydrogenase